MNSMFSKPLTVKRLIVLLKRGRPLAPFIRKYYKDVKVLDVDVVWTILRDRSQRMLARLEADDDPSPFKVLEEREESQRLQEFYSEAQWRKNRPRVALMYETSLANRECAAILLASHPIEKPTQRDKADSPAKYLPCDFFTKERTFNPGLRLPPLTQPLQPVTQSQKTSGLGSRSSAGPSVKFPALKPSVSTDHVETDDSHTSFRESRSFLEPLDIPSLLKVLPVVTAPGRGTFRCGRPAYWKVPDSSDF